MKHRESGDSLDRRHARPRQPKADTALADQPRPNEDMQQRASSGQAGVSARASEQADAALDESRAAADQFSAIFESMADGVIVCDQDGRVVRANRAFRDMLALANRPDYMSLPLAERGRLLAPRDELGQPLPMEMWLPFRVLRGELLPGADAVDFMIQTLDGRDILLNGSGAPTHNARGEVTGCVLIVRDVTERRRLERHTHDALDALLAMAEALVSNSTDSSGAPSTREEQTATAGMAPRLAELTRTVLGCQRVTLVPLGPAGEVYETFGVAGVITAEESQQWQANWPPAAQRRLQDFLPSAAIARLRHGESLPVDRAQTPYSRWPNPGGWRTMLLSPMSLGGRLAGVMTLDYGAAPHTFAPGEIALAAGVARLTTLVLERERLWRMREEERAKALALQEANRRMDEFLGIATHELRTPVTSGSLTIELAALRLRQARSQVAPSDGELAAELDAIQALLSQAEIRMDRLTRLVIDLLDVSRIRAGKLILRPTLCDLAEIVRAAITEQRQIASGRTILMHVPTKSVLLVLADADRIGQVVANFVTNAIKYSEADRPVEVQVSVRGAWARVVVRDQGPGLPRSEYKRIWDRFHRIQGIEVVSGGGIGLGLGLYICKSIIERHEGRIGVRSARGVGSSFWFALPLAHPTQRNEPGAPPLHRS